MNNKHLAPMLRQLFQGGAGGSRYAGHVPTTLLEKALLGSTSAVRALANPREAHLVGVVGETTGARALCKLLHRMERNPVGRAILQDRPLITSETLPMSSLRAMPAGSLGAAYGRFLERHGFDPDGRSPVRFVDDLDLAYVMLRYRQVHDLWSSDGLEAIADLLSESPQPTAPIGPRKVLVHASGFRQSPYADIKPADAAPGKPGKPGAPGKLWHSSPGSSGW